VRFKSYGAVDHIVGGFEGRKRRKGDRIIAVVIEVIEKIGSDLVGIETADAMEGIERIPRAENREDRALGERKSGVVAVGDEGAFAKTLEIGELGEVVGDGKKFVGESFEDKEENVVTSFFAEVAGVVVGSGRVSEIPVAGDELGIGERIEWSEIELFEAVGIKSGEFACVHGLFAP